jgi:nucleoid-associated protein Lsr2
MALVTRTYMTDDLDGSEGDVSTVRIALDKIDYEIDLSAANEARLRDKLARFVDAATELKTKPTTSRRGPKSAAVSTTRPDKEQTQAIREWAKANGYQVSDRGRISAAIQEAFAAAR